MSDNNKSIRITVRISRTSQAPLAKELSNLPPYERAKRFHLLASMGLAIERGRLPIASGGIQEAEHTSVDPQTASTTPSVEARQAVVEDKPTTKTEKYKPDLSDLWAAGVMAD